VAIGFAPEGSSSSSRPGLGASLRDQIAPLLVTLFGAVGIVGFVAVVGGVITWNRFNAVQLPADQAVAALPQTQLVAIGISALVIFLLLGMGAVILVAQIEKRGPGRRRWALLTLVALGMAYAIWIVPDATATGPIGITNLAKWGLTALIALAWVLAFVLLGWRSGEDGSALALKRWICGAGPGPGGKWRHRWARWLCRLDLSGGRRGWARRWLTTDPADATMRLMMLLFAAEMVFAVLLWQEVDTLLGATLLIGGVLGAICLLIADRPRNDFAGYAVAIFASVVVFGGATQAMQARYRPRVQPAALIRVGEEQGKGLCGLYVTENDERVYLARLRPDRGDRTLPAKGSGRIFFVDRKKVAALSIGPAMEIEQAAKRAPELRAELVVDAQPPAAAHDTVVTTRRYRRGRVHVQRRRTHVRTLAVATGTSAQATAGAPAGPTTSEVTADRDLAARRAEAELSCAPPPK
jgi:hypothetical protein